MKEIGFVKMKIEHVKEIVAAQQNYGKVVGLEERVKVEDLIEDVFRIHASELAQHEVKVRQEYPPGLPEILVDKHKVLQILLNLLSNAKHALADSGRKDKQVTVRVTNGGERIRIAMTDNGVGIPPANLRKIFNHGFTTRPRADTALGCTAAPWPPRKWAARCQPRVKVRAREQPSPSKSRSNRPHKTTQT